MKQIPNLFTLLNLIFGCIAIVFILQTSQSLVIYNETLHTYDPLFPEKMGWGALFIFFAAIVDFLDGFLARLLKAESKMGKQLDSLSDVVSFGVAPGMILYQLLRLGFAREENGLDVSFMALLPAFVFPAAVAWRLAKFNISSDQSHHFRGVPSPAAGLVVASFPLIIWYQSMNVQRYFIEVWILYGVIAILSYLMLSNRRFLALKFRSLSWKDNMWTYLLLLVSAALIPILGWLSVPAIFVLYVLVSFLAKGSDIPENRGPETLDVTV